MAVSSKTITIFLTVVWIVFSLVYISMDIWNDFKNKQLILAYQQGRMDTVNQIIKQAENEKCESFSVFSGEKQIQVINVNCLLKQTNNNKSEPK